jgi:hypothetical protein
MTASYLVHAPSFAIATRLAACWQCLQPMPMASLGVPAGYRMIDDGEESTEPDVGTLTYIRSLNPEALDQVSRRAPSLGWRASKTAGIEYLGNACSACGALQGDHYLHSEPGAAFFPLNEKEMAEIAVDWIDTPLVAAVDGVSPDSDWLR